MSTTQKINSWDCLLRSFELAMQKTRDELIVALGHDGSEIINEQAEDPARRRGFHVQEFVPYIFQQGKTLTPFEYVPTSWYGDEVRPVLTTVERDEFLEHIGRTSTGVITCRTESGQGHALALVKGLVIDPDTGDSFNYSLDDLLARRLYPNTIWVLR